MPINTDHDAPLHIVNAFTGGLQLTAPFERAVNGRACTLTPPRNPAEAGPQPQERSDSPANCGFSCGEAFIADHRRARGSRATSV